jgi:uncharacterized spore protein YtfJ
MSGKIFNLLGAIYNRVFKMDECENLLKATIIELEKLLTSKTVVGEPVTSEGMTVVPLLSVSFGFGGGASSGKGESAQAGGAGGGFKMKPVAVIVIEKDQVRVVPVEKSNEAKYPLMEGVLEKIPQLINDLRDRREEKEPKEGEKKETEISIE